MLKKIIAFQCNRKTLLHAGYDVMVGFCFEFNNNHNNQNVCLGFLRCRCSFFCKLFKLIISIFFQMQKYLYIYIPGKGEFIVGNIKFVRLQDNFSNENVYVLAENINFRQ
jgi:hypothetical protein